MKLRHAIAFGLLVVGLSTAYALFARTHAADVPLIIAGATLPLGAMVASGGKCCIGRRCYGRKADHGGEWQHWMWM